VATPEWAIRFWVTIFNGRKPKMADNKKKRGARDRATVAGNEGYEVRYFALKHNLSSGQARGLIERIGSNRNKLNAAASKLKSKRRTR